jgi:hypothetical protein
MFIFTKEMGEILVPFRKLDPDPDFIKASGSGYHFTIFFHPSIFFRISPAE